AREGRGLERACGAVELYADAEPGDRVERQLVSVHELRFPRSREDEEPSGGPIELPDSGLDPRGREHVEPELQQRPIHVNRRTSEHDSATQQSVSIQVSACAARVLRTGFYSDLRQLQSRAARGAGASRSRQRATQ